MFVMSIAIKIFARSALSILAVAVVLVFLFGLSSNSEELIGTGTSLFVLVLFGIIAVTLIINLSRRRF